MLSLWKLRVGVEEYYLAQVASGLDDYYTGAGEAVGEWTGGGATSMGLAGGVVASDLRAVMAGLAPGTALTPNGEQVQARKNRVPGFDLTFSVPKSVSVLYALGDPLLQGMVVESAEAALAEALSWLEREACFVRRGTNYRGAQVDASRWGTRRMATSGFVAARFPHRTSRAGDPHLHWHVLVANIARGVDGRWTALDGQALYANKRAAGVVFQTVLRAQLTRRLGVEWGPVRSDTAEVAGVPGSVLTLFSTRREQIREWLDDHGRAGPAAAAEAMAATRPPKADVPDQGLQGNWIARAVEAGWGPAQLEDLLQTPVTATNSTGSDPVVPDDAFPDWLGELVRSRLTAHDSTFTRGEVLQAVAGSLPQGADLAEVERLTHRVFADAGLVPLVGSTGSGRIDVGDRQVPDTSMRRWTTLELLGLEAQFTAHVTDGMGAGRGVLAADAAGRAVAAVEARAPGLEFGVDQLDAVTRLTTQGHGVEVLVGRAGTGKTTALAALRVAYEAAGYQVLGLAPSARAAREIEHDAGIESQTIARFLHRPFPLGLGTVAVVDEAAMAGTRDLVAAVDRVLDAGGKVILVGDHHQLPEITAGGGFAATLDILGEQACELSVVRRQTEPWERDALDELRDGDVTRAWDAYRAHDRITLIEDPALLHGQVIDDWWQHRQDGRDVLVLAGTRAEANALNRLARRRVAAAGLLSGPELAAGERVFHAGDRVVLRRNRRDQHDLAGRPAIVANGMLAEVARVDPGTGTMTVTIQPTREQVVLDADYVAGNVDHGYAVTIHKAQGLTCDVVLVVGPAGLNREAAYVALSRARHSAHLYATLDQVAELAERHSDHGIPLPAESGVDPEDAVLARLRRTGAKTFASRLDPEAATIADLAATHPLPALEDLAAAARTAERRCEGPHPDLLRDVARRSRRTRELLDVGRRVRALDRDNLGTVVTVDDRHATATIRFVSRSGTASTRTMAWADLRVVDHPADVAVPPTARRTLRRLETVADQQALRWDETLAAAGFAPGDAARLARAATFAAERAGHRLHATAPEWLTWWLAPRPADQVGALIWDDTVVSIAVWRERRQVPDTVPGLGPEPAEATESQRWRELTLTVVDTRHWLSARQPIPPLQLRERRPVELAARRAELEALLAAAPPDQSRIIEDLRAGVLTSSDLHAELAAAARSQEGRNTWILEHWPHLVELEQIDLLLADSDLLAHWPTPTPDAVSQALGVLARHAPTVEEPEEATLAELAARPDPIEQLQDRLEDLDDRLGALRAEHRTTPEASTERTMLNHTIRALARQRTQTISELTQLRHDRVMDRLFDLDDPDKSSLEHRKRRRTQTVVHTAFNDQPAWVVELLNDLHDDGTLAGLPDTALIGLVEDIALHRDRDGITGPDPLGPTPDDQARALIDPRLHDQAAIAPPAGGIEPR
jgi:conjugative relaxase-like TrwC/TraI family protein